MPLMGQLIREVDHARYGEPAQSVSQDYPRTGSARAALSLVAGRNGPSHIPVSRRRKRAIGLAHFVRLFIDRLLLETLPPATEQARDRWVTRP